MTAPGHRAEQHDVAALLRGRALAGMLSGRGRRTGKAAPSARELRRAQTKLQRRTVGGEQWFRADNAHGWLKREA